MFWLAFAVVLGGIVHVAAMLVIPTLAPKGGYSRFEATLEPNRATVAGPARPDDMTFPFASPDLIYVLCRYDVSERPIRFTASLPETYWSVSLYEPDGGNFFSIDSIQAPSGQADLVLLGRGDEYEASDTVTIAQATQPRGLIIMRAFLRDRTMDDIVREAADKAQCRSFEIE